MITEVVEMVETMKRVAVAVVPVALEWAAEAEAEALAEQAA